MLQQRHQWITHCQVLRPVPGQPRPLRVACERAAPGTPYDHGGATRASATHCLFKYTLGGHGCFENAGGRFAVPAGTGFLTPIGDPAMRYWLPDDATAPWTFLYVAVQTDRAVIEACIDRHGPIIAVPRASALVRRLLAFRHHARGVVDLTAAEAIRFTGELISDLVAHAQADQARDHRAILVERAREAVEACLDEPWTVNGLARQLAVSRETLHRACLQHLGASPGQWLLRRRMQHAQALLRQPGHSVSVVAARLGYTTPSHFARAFRRIIGQAPSAVLRGDAPPM